MLRIILGVIVGFIVWSIIWVGSDQVMIGAIGWYGEHQLAFEKAMVNKTPFTPLMSVLIMNIVKSMIISLIAGYIAAMGATGYTADQGRSNLYELQRCEIKGSDDAKSILRFLPWLGDPAFIPTDTPTPTSTPSHTPIPTWTMYPTSTSWKTTLTPATPTPTPTSTPTP